MAFGRGNSPRNCRRPHGWGSGSAVQPFFRPLPRGTRSGSERLFPGELSGQDGAPSELPLIVDGDWGILHALSDCSAAHYHPGRSAMLNRLLPPAFNLGSSRLRLLRHTREQCGNCLATLNLPCLTEGARTVA